LTTETSLSLTKFWQPRYWGLWAGIGILKLIVLLPVRWQLKIGRRIGRLLHYGARKRRHYARVNIHLCFPELDESAVDQLVLRHFESIGMSVIEMGLTWFTDREHLRRRTQVKGLEHFQAAMESNRGVLLYTGHFTTLEAAGPRLQMLCNNLHAVYRQINNPMLDALFMDGRQRSLAVIPKSNTRGIIRTLRKGATIWYAPDQAYVGKLSEVLDFFGEPAMTNVATSQLAHMSDAVVIPFFPSRTNDNGEWLIEFGPPLQDFPGGNARADTERLTTLLEAHIRTCPEQYYWIHRRFKGRPAPLADVYK
jgi:KDO2-lipid IV(A) lauroyltransferase